MDTPEVSKDWPHVGALALDGDWTGWTELALIDEDDDVEETKPRPRGQPPASAAVKGTPEDMNGEVVPEDQQTEEAPPLDHGDEMSDVNQGLNMLGFRDEVVEWLVNADVGIMPELNEFRRAARVHGKG